MSNEVADRLMLDIRREIEIKAPPAIVWEAMLAQIGPEFETPNGKMPLVVEPWPGGRWFRDLGHNTGHFWGHVQVIKPPTLLELNGPMFMSYPAVSHIQYRLAEQPGGTRLSITHRALGDIAPEHRAGVGMGWEMMLKHIQQRAMR